MTVTSLPEPPEGPLRPPTLRWVAGSSADAGGPHAEAQPPGRSDRRGWEQGWKPGEGSPAAPPQGPAPSDRSKSVAPNVYS